jgi:hypothetical protein
MSDSSRRGRARRGKVVSWKRVKSEMKRKKVMIEDASICCAQKQPKEIGQQSAVVLHLPAPDRLSKNHGASEPGERSDLQCRELRTSSATRGRPSPDVRAPAGGGSSGPGGHTCDQEVSPCPIMGKFLPVSQWVGIYQSETLYPSEAVASSEMAKPLEKHQKAALRALRENLIALRGDQSQGDIGQAIGAPKGNQAIAAGRNVTNLVPKTTDDLPVKGTVPQIPLAAKAYGVESWQLWLPGFSALNEQDRESLTEIVQLFMDKPAARPLLTGALQVFNIAAPKIPDAVVTSSTAVVRRRQQ